MSLWGAGVDSDLVKKYTHDGRFRVLSDREKAVMKKQFIELAPAKNPIKKIEIALESGVLVEYLVDTGVITRGNVYDIDVDVEKRQFILDYLDYKEGGKAEEIKVYLMAKDEESFNKVKENLEGCELIDIKPVLNFDDLKITLGSSGGAVIVVGDNITDEQRTDVQVLYDIVESEKVEGVVFLDAVGILQDAGCVYRIPEVLGKYVKMAFNKNWDILKSACDISKDKENEGEIAEIVEVAEEERAEGEDEEIGVLGVDEEDAKIGGRYTDEDVKKAIDRALEVEASRYQGSIDSLKEIIDLKESQINSLKERLDVALEQVDKLRESLRGSREELQNKSLELKELIKENVELKEVKVLYEAIIDDYKELKEFKKESEGIIEVLKEEYEAKISEYIKIADNAEKSVKELKKAFDDYYDKTDGEGVDFTAVIRSPLGYFRVIGEPRFFYSMLKYLIIYLRSCGKKVLLLSFRDVGFYFKPFLADWVEINQVESEIDLENSDHKVYVQKAGKKESILIEGLAERYDVVLVLDYRLGENVLVTGPRMKEVFVVKEGKDIERLGAFGKDIVCEDKDYSVIDISFDESMSRFTNERVKAMFYQKRVKDWVQGLMEG